MINKNEEKFILFILLGLFLFVALKSAWVCDDAYITFKTLGNFLAGHGLRYNLAERVQAFTHPLWLFLLAVPTFFTHEPYYTSIFLSLFLTLVAVLILAFRIASSFFMALAAMVILIFSKAFIDYSTSGLENPLTYFLLAIFAHLFLKFEPNGRKLFALSLTASLGALNRMDTLIIFLPAIIYTMWQIRKIRAFYQLAAGFVPFILWEGFSLFYYGFLFPNTAYAKLSTGIPSMALIQQGFYYFLNSLHLDPPTLLIISVAIVLSFFKENRRFLPLSLGIIFYLLYIVKIGGDFMSGRFLSAPFFLAVILISNLELSNLTLGVFLFVVLALGFSSPYAPIFSNADYGKERHPQLGGLIYIDNKGIADERAFYYPGFGLLKASRFFPPHLFRWREGGEAGHVSTAEVGQVNIGFYALPLVSSVHLADEFALVDPLLARLPAYPDPFWRIGHFRRRTPEGYTETLGSGQNRIKNKKLALYYDKLSLITRGDLFDTRRLKEIIKFNLGYYDHLIEDVVFRRKVALKEIENPKPEGTRWDAPGNILINSRWGLSVDLGASAKAGMVEIGLDHNDEYWIEYYHDNQLLARRKVPLKFVPQGGLAVHSLLVPPAAVEKGYNKIKILPKGGDWVYSLGHLQIIP